MPLDLQSTAFQNNVEIPTKYTCEGSDVSPPLSWSGAPAGTKSYALIVSDPDAPDPKAPKRVWTHSVLFNVPPAVTSLPEGAKPKVIAKEIGTGRNDFGQLLSNVLDPSLVIGAGYQARTVATTDGRVLAGLVVEDGPQLGARP